MNVTILSITLSQRLLCDLELIGTGGFAPLKGFMKEKDYKSCLKNLRLKNGSLFPIPIVLPIDEKKKQELNSNKETYVTLRDEHFYPVAKMRIEEIYKPDIEHEAECVFGTYDLNHPYIQIMADYKNCYYVGGEVVEYYGVKHVDFEHLRLGPRETKKYISENWKGKNVVGFQTRNPMHRSHFELTKYAISQAEDSCLLLNPVVGITQPCDVEYHTRVRCYEKLLSYYEKEGIKVKLVLLPLSMRMAGPREALWHSIIRKNYGCSHFVVGRDHAGPSYKREDGKSFFGPYDAQDLVNKHKNEVGIEIVTAKFIVWCVSPEGNGEYRQIDQVPKDWEVKMISGTQQREMLENGKEIPEWFTFPEIANELYKQYVPLQKRGLCLYFVGLSASGKTTIANAMVQKLKELLPEKKITYLDGDVVRTNLSAGLGFSKEDRSKNVRRIGFVAKEVVRHGGICVCANIAPYEADRNYNKIQIDSLGNYIEIYVNTPLEMCSERDPKGLYKLAMEGKIKQFTGVSDPFEEPQSNLTLDGTKSVRKNVFEIVDYLKNKKLIN